MRRITFDIETTNTSNIIDPKQMEISVVGVHDSLTDTLTAFTVPEFPALWPILEHADVLIGFNSDHFDIPILNKYYTGDLTTIRSIDLLTAVRESLGRRIKLDLIAKATLGTKKSGSGLDAVKWWKEGKYEKVKKYCLDDVKITKDIYEYALKNGFLKYLDFGKVRQIPIDTSSWETGTKTALTHTLPF